MTVRPATKRRIIWALSIGALLIAIVVGMLTFVDLTTPVEETKRCAPSIWRSQWPKYIGCAMGVHEDLAAGLIGGAGALFAAWLAFDAIQEQLGEERYLRHRQQLEAKEAAVVCIAQPVHAAAATLNAIGRALASHPHDHEEADRFVDLGISYTRGTLDSFTIRESVDGLDVDDKVLYLVIVATLAAFVNTSLNPSPTMPRRVRLENQRDMLMRLHNYIRPFDPELADVFARDSNTTAPGSNAQTG